MNRNTHEQIIEHEIQKAMDAMFPHGAGRATHTHVRHWLETVGKVAFGQGGDYALMSLLTVEEVAERFNVTPRRVRAIAKNRHERFGIGWQVPGTNQWLFRPEELEILEPDEKYRQKKAVPEDEKLIQEEQRINEAEIWGPEGRPKGTWI